MRRGMAVLAAVLLTAALLPIVGCESPHAPSVTGSRPAILSITFPAKIVADGTPYEGTIVFSDPDGDVVLVEFKSGGTKTGSFNPDVGGQTGGTIRFTYWATGSGDYTISVTLRDGNGNSSSPRSFSFTAVPAIAFRGTTSQILAEFEANVVAAELKYEGKRLAVSGYIERFDTYWGDEPIVTLGAQPGGSSFDPEVLCYFPLDERASVAQLAKGDFVTVVGEYWMYGLGNVYLHYCYVEQ